MKTRAPGLAVAALVAVGSVFVAGLLLGGLGAWLFL